MADLGGFTPTLTLPLRGRGFFLLVGDGDFYGAFIHSVAGVHSSFDKLRMNDCPLPFLVIPPDNEFPSVPPKNPHGDSAKAR